jgi:hypothetical protein
MVEHERQFEITVACDSTLYWKAGTRSNHVSEFILPIIENEVCTTQDKPLLFNMRATQILGIDGARVRDWLSAMTDIESLQSWNKTGQILFWIDMGNSWAHDRMADIKVDEVLELFGSLVGCGGESSWCLAPPLGVQKLVLNGHHDQAPPANDSVPASLTSS